MHRARVKVLLADDHPIYREGLARAIKERPELHLVAQAGSGREALDLIRNYGPDVVVLDVRMPDLDGPSVMRALRRESLDVGVLFLSAGTDGGTSYGVVADGAKGYLTKRAGPRLTEREHEVLRLVAEGLSAPEIGRAVHLSPTTVKGHLHTLYEKLGVS